MKFQIKSRFSSATLFECELSASFDSEPESVRLGEALKRAVASDANLSGAYLRDANLSGAYLSDANLSGAYLSGAKGVQRERFMPLLALLYQPGVMRYFKLVTADYMSPIQNSNRIKYEIGCEVEATASTDENDLCAAGVNVATLDWCLKEHKPGWRILTVDFTAEDIACIPTGTDGKFRLHRCIVTGEIPQEQIAVWLGADAPQAVAA